MPQVQVIKPSVSFGLVSNQDNQEMAEESNMRTRPQTQGDVMNNLNSVSSIAFVDQVNNSSNQGGNPFTEKRVSYSQQDIQFGPRNSMTYGTMTDSQFINKRNDNSFGLHCRYHKHRSSQVSRRARNQLSSNNLPFKIDPKDNLLIQPGDGVHTMMNQSSQMERFNK